MMQDSPFPLITIDDGKVVRFAMEQLSLWETGEAIERVDRAGEGNMNAVLRVATNRRCIILKQSRPWVEKYPQIAAPADRILAEIDFYGRVSSKASVSGLMPRLLASCAELFLMAMEDLGKANDYSDLYSMRSADSMPLHQAISWLAQLHRIPIDSNQRDKVGNRELRTLNHAHIFVIPLQMPAAIPLDKICDGLERLASQARSDATIQAAARELGERYLGTGENLLHGDYYPGSWLCTSDGFRVIDPEFCFTGPAEFDLAVLAAHRVMAGGADDSVTVVCEEYANAGGANVDQRLVSGFAGMEIIRRLIGVAQLPLSATLADRTEMMRIAIRLLVG